MGNIATRLEQVGRRIAAAERDYGRAPGSVRLLAVSKGHNAAAIRAAFAAGQRCFGESYLQEASAKLDALHALAIEWHYIGRIQSNKAADVARLFDWVHSVDRLKIARLLSTHRPATLPPLQICLQVKLSTEPNKSGVDPSELEALAKSVAELPRLHLRGLMALPQQSASFDAQRKPFRRLRELQQRLSNAGHRLDTLSMGMSGDLEAAVAEGATVVRVGTAIFGARRPAPQASNSNAHDL